MKRIVTKQHQFLWQDLSSDFDVLGPYFTLSSNMEARYLHSIVTKTMLVFTSTDFIFDAYYAMEQAVIFPC